MSCCECCLSCLRVVENVPILGHMVAAVYACANNKDKAERAGIKSSVGLLCCPCNATVEFADEAFRTRPPKLPSLGVTQRTDWMKQFSHRTIRSICLPGSHQSGTYNMHRKLKEVPMVEGWSRCQSLSIKMQLYMGIRFLDLRVMDDDGDVWLHHNAVVCMKLREALRDVREFVLANPSEIVGIYITNNGKSIDWGKVNTYVQESLRELLIFEHMRDLKIEDIVDGARNVIIFGIPNVAYAWTKLKYHWPNRACPKELKNDLHGKLRDISFDPPDQLYWYKAECTPDAATVVRSSGGLPGAVYANRASGKFDFIEELAAAANYRVLEVLDDISRLPFNILSIDYVQDDIVGKIIELNDKYDAGEAFAAVTSEGLEGDELVSERSTLLGRGFGVGNVSIHSGNRSSNMSNPTGNRYSNLTNTSMQGSRMANVSMQSSTTSSFSRPVRQVQPPIAVRETST